MTPPPKPPVPVRTTTRQGKEKLKMVLLIASNLYSFYKQLKRKKKIFISLDVKNLFFYVIFHNFFVSLQIVAEKYFL